MYKWQKRIKLNYMKIPKYLSAGQKIRVIYYFKNIEVSVAMASREQNVYKSNLGFFQTIPKVIIISKYKKNNVHTWYSRAPSASI